MKLTEQRKNDKSPCQKFMFKVSFKVRERVCNLELIRVGAFIISEKD